MAILKNPHPINRYYFVSLFKQFILLPGLVLSALAFLLGPVDAKQNCGTAQDMCKTSMGDYVIRLPDNPSATPVPALIFFHGYGSSGSGTLKNKGMVDAFLDRGYAIIAPNATKPPGTNFRASWAFFPNQPTHRDEMKFIKEVLEDAAKRHNIDRDNILMSGFSIGGSLAWYLACEDPSVARAYAPVAGAFWRPHPDAADCKGPVRMLHTHGWRDKTVPLEGRPLRGINLIQGDVFYSLQIMRQVNGCKQMRADSFITEGKFWRRKWTRCTPNSALELALHTGGHGVPKGWATMAMDWFEGLK